MLRGLEVEAPRPLECWKPIALRDSADLVLTGVGKSNAAGGVATTLAQRHHAVLSLGLSGALPGSGLRVGDTLAASWSTLADEGSCSSEGFRSQSAMGFPAVEGLGERFPADEKWTAILGARTTAIGGCATVSTCSATDTLAAEIACRTGAAAEDMESAAVGLVAARASRRFGCVRVISNRAGSDQGWDLEGALHALSVVAGAVCSA